MIATTTQNMANVSFFLRKANTLNNIWCRLHFDETYVIDTVIFIEVYYMIHTANLYCRIDINSEGFKWCKLGIHKDARQDIPHHMSMWYNGRLMGLGDGGSCAGGQQGYWDKDCIKWRAYPRGIQKLEIRRAKNIIFEITDNKRVDPGTMKKCITL